MASLMMTTSACFSRPKECHNCQRKNRDPVMEQSEEVRKPCTALHCCAALGLTMLLFVRIVSLGYLYNFLILGNTQWVLAAFYTLFLIVIISYSCFLTLALRNRHDNALIYYQHMAYA